MVKQMLLYITSLAILICFAGLKTSYAQGQNVLHLTFEEDVSDQSELENLVIPNGNPTFSDDAAEGSSSIYFDGTDDYLEIEGANLALESFTLDFYFKPDSVNGATWLINKWGEDKGDGTYFNRTNYGVIIHSPGGVIGGVEWDLGANDGNGGPTGGNQRSGNDDGEETLEVGVWYNAIFVGSADTSFFQLRDLEGNLLGEGGYKPVGAYATNSNQPLRIAWAGVDASNNVPRFFNGWMDDIYIYNYARIDDEGNYIDPRNNTIVSNEISEDKPEEIDLSQNYPNPFNPSTRIEYSVQKSGSVTLKVYNVLGKKVSTLVNGTKTAGKHAVTFRAENLPSGIYYYKLETDFGSSVKSMSLIK